MSDRTLRVAVALTACAGLVLAAYLTWAHYDQDLLICTAAGGGCEAVQESEYATVAGVPVALLGTIAYAVVLALLAWDAPPARTAAAGIALAALAFALYLIAVQAFVLEAWCAWCLVNDVLIVPALAAVCVARVSSR